MSVVDLASRRAEREQEGWANGAARCLACKHEWQAVAPRSTDWLECPTCTMVKGRFVYHYVPREGREKWECACGNDLLNVLRDGVFCPACGADQEFPR